MSSIVLYLGLLILGGLLSYKGLVHKELFHRLDMVQLICLFVLLFTMGLRIGMDDKVIEAFAQIGFHASIFAAFTVIGSVFFVMVFRRGWLWLRREKA